jgi:DNA-binding response OmpR family regulator
MTALPIEHSSLLLVDDDPLSLELLQGYLQTTGYRLTLADDGVAAWELLRDPRNHFDLVITDRSMPRMDGMELLRRIKSEPRLAELPVVFETALTQQSEIAEGIAAGVYYYLTKPFNYRLLLAVVKAALEARAEHAALVAATGRITATFGLMKAARFQFRTGAEARELSSVLAAMTARPDNVALGLSELLLNAVEHGNLGISYREKSELLLAGKLQDEIQRRLEASPWAARWAAVDVERGDQGVRFCITDEGDGFDPTCYLDLDPARALDPNGRGIAMARLISFSTLEYQGKGNVVVATVIS